MKSCSVKNCARKYYAKGFCKGHYDRARVNDDLFRPFEPRHKTREEAFSAYTEKSGDCLIWTGCINDAGYGLMRYKGGSYRAHRYAWEKEWGRIPAGMHLDHICHNRKCVNVEHLRLATPAQNTYNKSGAQRSSLTGVRNVSYRKKGNCFDVGVMKNGVSYRVHGLKSLDEASAVAEKIRGELFGAYAGKG